MNNDIFIPEMNPKQKQKHLLSKVRPFFKISNADLSVMLNVSTGLVSYVWAGANCNPKVLKAIYDNLTEGWDNDLTPKEIKAIQEICQ
jgi:hypothetical protein